MIPIEKIIGDYKFRVTTFTPGTEVASAEETTVGQYTGCDLMLEPQGVWCKVYIVPEGGFVYKYINGDASALGERSAAWATFYEQIQQQQREQIAVQQGQQELSQHYGEFTFRGDHRKVGNEEVNVGTQAGTSHRGVYTGCDLLLHPKDVWCEVYAWPHGFFYLNRQQRDGISFPSPLGVVPPRGTYFTLIFCIRHMTHWS